MSAEEIVRAWKDPDYRDQTPGLDHPAGAIELDVVAGNDTELALNTRRQCTYTCEIRCTYAPDCYWAAEA